MEDLEFKIEDGGLWIEDRHSKFEDSIKPHLKLTHTFLFIFCHKSRYFEDIVMLWIFRLRTIHNFFHVCASPTQKGCKVSNNRINSFLANSFHPVFFSKNSKLFAPFVRCLIWELNCSQSNDFHCNGFTGGNYILVIITVYTPGYEAGWINIMMVYCRSVSDE